VIKFRYSTFEKHVNDFDLEIKSGERLNALMGRIIKPEYLGDYSIEEVFQVSVNGIKVEHDFWSFTELKETDSVLIMPSLKSGDSNTLRSVLQITAVVVASYFLGPAGAGLTGLGLGAAVAGVSIATSLILTALIPPPTLEFGNFGGPDSLASSQMYSITNQSNSVRKLGLVPRMYGTHRVYPFVAANPYTELEVDPDTGQIVQYLYALYDFGFGPLVVDNVKIGDTPITDFADFNYRLVDFNRPTVSEGAWDDATSNFLEYYKGDQNINSVSVGLNSDQSGGGPLDGYQAIRNSAENTDGSKQEISLSFVNPSGLFGYSAGGLLGPRAIVLDIKFALVGTEDWKGFNDTDVVDSFDAVGGDQAVFNLGLELFPPSSGGGIYDFLSETCTGRRPAEAWDYNQSLPRPFPVIYESSTIPFYIRQFGWAAGRTQIVLKDVDPSFILFGSAIFYQGSFVGTVQSTAEYGPNTAYTLITLRKPIAKSIPLFTYDGYKAGTYMSGLSLVTVPEYWRGKDAAVLGKISAGANSLGKAVIERQDTGAVYSLFKFTPKVAGQYKVRVTRESTSGTYTSQIQDDLTWVSITTRFDRSPIVTDKRHTFLELKIRATNQLNGSIQNLSAICTSVLDVYDGVSWSKQPTQNPAWAFVDLLTGQVNKRPVDKSRLHMDSILEWADFCEEIPTAPTGRLYQLPRFRCDFVLDYAGTLQSVLNQITSAAQASLNIVDGKYGVLIDRLRTVPVQLFTPRNSRDFSSSRQYSTRPHGVRVKFIDPTSDWNVSEVVVYDNGYDETTATDIQELTSFACTNEEQAWRFGRYMIAQNALRQETISLTVDFEHLVCTRGDYVQITQDVMRVGGTPARVRSVSGNQITIDDGIETVPGTYGYVFRGADGLISNDTLTVVNSDTFDLDGPMPQVGDLIVIGVVSQIVYDCLVKSISPNDDLSASLILIEKADAIYDYESSDTFPTYESQISSTTNPDVAPPAQVQDLAVVDTGYECAGSGYEYFVELDWNPPGGSAYETFEVFVNYGRGFTEVAKTRQSTYRYIVDQNYLGAEHEFKVIAVSATGRKLDLGAVTGVTSTPLSKTALPSDVESLDIDITGEVLQLVWPQIPDCDCREYLIRYSPTLLGTWESSIPLLRIDRNATLAATQARTGTYLIKAVDFNGNESANVAQAITTIPNLFDLNVIEEISDAPTWLGTFDRTRKEGDTVVLRNTISGGIDTAEFYPEGLYYYKDLLDLGEIYTVRLQSLIQAEGYTVGDLMSSWVTLSSVALLSSARTSEWDVETQYRSTETLNVIADWVTLSAVSAMQSGVAENFTEWRKFIMGDATGRIFQFRLRLISNKVSVSPRVFDGTIRADMPDRLESYNGLSADDTTGYILAYAPAFAGPGSSPNVQVTIDDAESGDYWAFDYKTLDGFQIKFYDKTDTQVARSFDVSVKGYGRKATAVI